MHIHQKTKFTTYKITYQVGQKFSGSRRGWSQGPAGNDKKNQDTKFSAAKITTVHRYHGTNQQDKPTTFLVTSASPTRNIYML